MNFQNWELFSGPLGISTKLSSIFVPFFVAFLHVSKSSLSDALAIYSFLFFLDFFSLLCFDNKTKNNTIHFHLARKNS